VDGASKFDRDARMAVSAAMAVAALALRGESGDKSSIIVVS
jgi:hypothetical protein